MTSARQRLGLVLLVGLLPWTVVTTGGVTTVFFPVGFLDAARPERLVTIYEFFVVFTRGLPQYYYAWPIGVVLYATALTSAALGVADREDRRLTAGLLVLVGLTQLQFALAQASRPTYVAVPVATITTTTLVWWVYWPEIKGGFFATA